MARESFTLIGIFLICQWTAKTIFNIKRQWKSDVHVTQGTLCGAHFHFHSSQIGLKFLQDRESRMCCALNPSPRLCCVTWAPSAERGNVEAGRGCHGSTPLLTSLWYCLAFAYVDCHSGPAGWDNVMAFQISCGSSSLFHLDKTQSCVRTGIFIPQKFHSLVHLFTYLLVALLMDPRALLMLGKSWS